jgi:flagellar export protein FliJ
MARTRLDRLVQLRDRQETEALAGMARARAGLAAARDQLATAVHAARVDSRAAGHAALWELDDAARRRALQTVRAARGNVERAAAHHDAAHGSYLSARQDAEVMRRAAERKRQVLQHEAARRERRAQDEIATLRFNHK